MLRTQFRALGAATALAVLACPLAAQTTTAAANPFARALPESTLMYMSFPNFSKSLEEFQSMPLAKMWAEDEVQDFFERAMTMGKEYWEQGMAQARAMHEQGQLPFDPDELVKARLESLSFAITSMELQMPEGAREPLPRFGFVIYPRFTLMDVVLVSLNGLLIVGVVGWAIALWMQGQASVGVVAAATALTLRLNAMTGWIMWALTTFFRQLGVVAEGMETIAQPIDLVDAAAARPLALREGKIELRGLSHHYGRGAGGLDRIDLTIEPGQKVGLIGRSGAGKSTLIKLLLRFYDAEAGQILIDGQDISEVRQDSLRGHIGMVQQDSSLLHRSVRDNILYGRPDATDDELRRSLDRELETGASRRDAAATVAARFDVAPNRVKRLLSG